MTKQGMTVPVIGVKCRGCVKKLTTALQALDNEAQVSVDIDKQQLSLQSCLSSEQVKKVLSKLDYLPTAKEKAEKPVEKVLSDSESTVVTHFGQSLNFSITGMTCAACVNSVEKALKQIDGVKHASVNFANRTAQVSGEVTKETIINAVKNAGYQAQLIDDLDEAESQRAEQEQQAYQKKRLQSWVGIIIGLLLMGYGLFGGDMMISTGTSQLVWGTVGLLCLGVMWFCGRHFYRGAWLMAKRGSSNMDTLVALGTLSAWLYSMAVVCFPNLFDVASRHVYFEAAVMILGMINLGQALELKTRGKTSQAIRRLLDLRVKHAQVIRNGEEMMLPIEQVIVGDGVRVRAGEQIPVDGVLLEGSSRVNEAMLTGEPLTVKKYAGDKVFAGTLNSEGSFIMQASQIGHETKLAQIIQMISQAQNSKPPMSRLADKVVAIFVPVVVLIALLTALIWWVAGADSSHILVTAVSVLIIACPCALGLATPISTMIGVGKAAENGGLIRNGDALQRAADIDMVVLDKTGTITQGKPTVAESFIVEQQNNQQVLSLIAAMEQGSTHPLAKALLDYCQKNQQSVDGKNIQQQIRLDNLNSVSGRGMVADWAGKKLSLGNEALILEAGVNPRAMTAYQVFTKEKSTDCTRVFFAIDNELQATFAIADTIRDEAVLAIEQLHQQGVKVVMLTGDNPKTAAAIAEKTGIDNWRAQCLPEDKLNYVKQQQDKGYHLAVVGDGINDAPALAIADVGFAIGEGADAAIESAEITLLNPSLHGIANVIGISEATLKNIKQNLWGAFVYNSLGIPIAAGILYPWTGLLLSPIIAGAAMSLSSVTVVSNANRLRLWRHS